MTHKFLMMTMYEDMRVDNGRGWLTDNEEVVRNFFLTNRTYMIYMHLTYMWLEFNSISKWINVNQMAVVLFIAGNQKKKVWRKKWERNLIGWWLCKIRIRPPLVSFLIFSSTKLRSHLDGGRRGYERTSSRRYSFYLILDPPDATPPF